MKIISWNINGIRSNIVDSNTAKYKKPREIKKNSSFWKIITKYDPDIVCFQETRLSPELYYLFETENIKKYFPYQYWSSSEGEKSRSGNRYSGTSIWSKFEAKTAEYHIDKLNKNEGRFIRLDFDNLIVITTYTPNSGSNWDYRLNAWEPTIRNYLKKLCKKNKPVVYCGDNNIANKKDIWFGEMLNKRCETEKDPEKKRKLLIKVKNKNKFHLGTEIIYGYSMEERNAYDKLLSKTKMIDCYRYIYPNICDKFTWFNVRIRKSFENNIGWLIDRFLIQNKHKNLIGKCEILHEIGTRNSKGIFISDHIPILLELTDFEDQC